MKMPISSSQFTLSETEATQIVVPDNMIQKVTLHNMTKSSNEYIYIGPSSVTTSNAIHIDPGETLQLQIRPGDDLWAVSDPDGLVVGVLVVTKRD